MKISIGPIPTNLGEKRLWQFYEEVAGSPAVERVYIGEVACTKRDVLDRNLLLKLTGLLEQKGKEVVFSSYVLPTNQQDLDRNYTLAKTSVKVEVNNHGMLQLLLEKFYKRPFIIGPYLNCYNLDSVRYLADLGAEHIVFNPDIEASTIVQIAQSSPVTMEIIGHGHLPLGFSGRCYTAFAFGDNRNTCRFACYRSSEMSLTDQEGRPMFLINGPSVSSSNISCLLYRINDLQKMGINFVRITPVLDKLTETVAVFEKVIKGELVPEKGVEQLFGDSPVKPDLDFCCLGE